MAGAGEIFEPGLTILDLLFSSPGEFGDPLPAREMARPPVIADLPGFILDSESGLLFGESPARSLSLAMPVRGLALRERMDDALPDEAPALAWTFGPPLADAAGNGRQVDFLQLLMVESNEPVSRSFLSGLSSLRSLAGRIPGYLAHSTGNETTARIHRDLLGKGFSVTHLAAAHVDQAQARGFSGAVFVAVGIPSPKALEMLAPFAQKLRTAAENLAAPVPDEKDGGTEGCYGRTCGECDERDVCEKIRAVLKKYPRKTGR